MTGAGVEWAFANNWSAKVEYDYLDFGTHAETINGRLVGIPATFGVQNEQHINQVKVGLNWRFLPNAERSLRLRKPENCRGGASAAAL
jgi:opacity protein-like surface antigen